MRNSGEIADGIPGISKKKNLKESREDIPKEMHSSGIPGVI